MHKNTALTSSQTKDIRSMELTRVSTTRDLGINIAHFGGH